MTIEEAMAKIDELEKENARLCEAYSRKERRFVIPDIAITLYPYLYNRVMDRNHRVFAPFYTELLKLSFVIRSLCFPKVSKKRTYKGREFNGDCPIAILDMTDEQYKKYSEVMCAILGVLDKHIIDKRGFSE